MHKESKKALVIGLVLSAVCCVLITTAIDYALHPAIYSPAVLGAFLGMMFTMYGITNSGKQSIEEFHQERPWLKEYRVNN
jgi:uncharacterized membrane protein YfbV (UPF0208 family)